MDKSQDIVQICPTCDEGIYVPYGTEDDEKELVTRLVAHGITPPALSRRDNKTYICSSCGNVEAVEDFLGLTKE